MESSQPPAIASPNALGQIRAENQRTGRYVVVLDDDPTGSQVVHDVPVLTRWEDADLVWAFAHPARTFFIQTNTRSLGAAAARELLREVAARVSRVAATLGHDFVTISRSDSTLRGHFPLETDVLQEEAATRGTPFDALVLVPAYFEAARVTVDDVHYAGEGGLFVPVAETDYAHDEAFGYHSSTLPEWVEEKTGARVPASSVISVSLDDLRTGGVAHTSRKLRQARDGAVVVVNVLAASDMEVLVQAVIAAEAAGWRALCRVGPSFVRTRLGMPEKPPLSSSDLFPSTAKRRRGLIIVGSHVELATRQLDLLLGLQDLESVELDVEALADPDTARYEIDRAAEALLRTADNDVDLLLATSRKRVVTQSGESSLTLSRQVSSALVEITRRTYMYVSFDWVLAKGGITSQDIATEALRIRRATVLGQLFPGTVSAWRREADTGEPEDDAGADGLRFVVFPGNVGGDGALRDAVLILRGRDA